LFVEHLWHKAERERVYLRACDSFSAARADIAKYFDRESLDRPQSKIERLRR
jgi:hypothetical protein